MYTIICIILSKPRCFTNGKIGLQHTKNIILLSYVCGIKERERPDKHCVSVSKKSKYSRKRTLYPRHRAETEISGRLYYTHRYIPYVCYIIYICKKKKIEEVSVCCYIIFILFFCSPADKSNNIYTTCLHCIVFYKTLFFSSVINVENICHREVYINIYICSIFRCKYACFFVRT